MTRVITVTNRKGGVGKSVTAQNLSAGLALRNYKVLLIDLDSQTSVSVSCGANLKALNSYEMLMQNETASNCIQSINGKYDIIPASRDLSRINVDLVEIGKEYRLKEMLEPIKANYDFIIIDTPPALDIITINALTVADEVVVIAQADLYNLIALQQLQDTIKIVKQYTNAKLTVDGILLTRYKGNTKVTQELTNIIEDLGKTFSAKVYNAKIRETVTVIKAQANCTDLFEYAPKSEVTNDYNNFIDELLGK